VLSWVGSGYNEAQAAKSAEKPASPDKGAALAFLNTATSQQLTAKLGLGKATTDHIIAGRPYKNINELHAKKIVSMAVFHRIEIRLGVRP
jgi:DNA uptake protein ComE-like DNA-binding protein